MTTTSNSYADKVFSEHPLALWSMDESVHYVSLLSELERTMSGWTLSGGTVSEYVPGVTGSLDKKLDSIINQITIPANVSTGTIITSFISPSIASSSDFNHAMRTFAVSTYIHQELQTMTVDLGYKYTRTSDAQVIENTKTFQLSNFNNWSFIAESFELPTYDFTDFKIIINIKMQGPLNIDQNILINGLSLGQWSEQFYTTSTGAIPEILPNTIPISGYGVPANAYGLQDRKAYYISKSNRLMARNGGIPLVFGTSSVTQIIPTSDGSPSFIFHGMGFMNDVGQYSDLTLEFWMRIQTSSATPKRILGPVSESSKDGLYVNDSFLALRIGEVSKSFFVKEWDRPMLISIRLSATTASLTVNGEEVVTIALDSANINYPAKTITVDGVTIDQDWIGVYAYDDVPLIELDCVGIYPYTVPNIVAKRRFAYGQAVQVPEAITGSSIGTSIAADYPSSRYTKNYIYPDIGKWKQGINENLSISDNSISAMQYDLPEFRFSNQSYATWFKDVKAIQDGSPDFIHLKPNSLWSNTEGYILFQSASILSQDTQAFYGVFQITDYVSDQILFYIKNEITGDVFKIFASEEEIFYTLNNQFGIVPSGSYVSGEYCVVGIDLNKFKAEYGSEISSFFGTPSQLKFYVGGNPNFSDTFNGKIFRVGFCTSRNLQKIQDIFSSDGTVYSTSEFTSFSALYDAGLFSTTSWNNSIDGGDSYFGSLNDGFSDVLDGGSTYGFMFDVMGNHVASYTLTPKQLLGNFTIDIATNGYWQDYIPLSYFGTYIDGGDGNEYFSVDFMQFNIAYPQLNSYLDKTYNTENSIVKTYISFDYLENSASIDIDNYSTDLEEAKITKTERAPKNNLIIPGSDWLTTKYELVNDSLIYPPKDVDLNNINLVLHIEVLSGGFLENPVAIESLQIASQSFNAFIPNPVGTKYGVDLFPYRRSAEYYDYKGRNPYTIYKGSTPYLYLTSTSGFRLRGFIDNDLERGISLPINANKTDIYKMAALQLNIRYDGSLFPSTPNPIFEIESSNSTLPTYIKFYMVPEVTNSKRARIYPINARTGKAQDGVVFFINGKATSAPIIDINTWAMLGIVFNTPVSFNGNEGAVRITGPIIFNNLSHYVTNILDEQNKSSYRKWISVSYTDGDKTWGYWKDGDSLADPVIQPFTWQTVLYANEEKQEVVDGELIYNKYTGTNRIVVDSGSIFKIKNYKYLVYKDNTWQSKTIAPA